MKKKLIPSIAVGVAMLIIILNPDIYIKSAQSGLLLFVINVLPALFPFFFFSKLLIVFDADVALGRLLSKPLSKTYNAPHCTGYIMVMSILCGYPIGAKLIADYYEEGIIDKKSSSMLASMASTAGPLFILGTIGASIMMNATVGYIILISHILSAFINGFLYKSKSFINHDTLKKSQTTISDSIYHAVISILLVGGYIVIFNIICDMLINTNIISLLSKIMPFKNGINEGILISFVEITRGTVEIAGSGANIITKTAAITGAVTFGGFSILMQSYTFLQKVGIKISKLLLFKLTQCGISVAIAFFISSFLL